MSKEQYVVIDKTTGEIVPIDEWMERDDRHPYIDTAYMVIDFSQSYWEE